MNFKKYRGINLSYKEQGIIYFTCANFDTQPPEMQEKIRRLCKEVGGPYEKALLAMVTRPSVSGTWLEQEYHVSDSQLYRLRKQFYERWNRYGNENVPGVREGV